MDANFRAWSSPHAAGSWVWLRNTPSPWRELTFLACPLHSMVARPRQPQFAAPARARSSTHNPQPGSERLRAIRCQGFREAAPHGRIPMRKRCQPAPAGSDGPSSETPGLPLTRRLADDRTVAAVSESDTVQ